LSIPFIPEVEIYTDLAWGIMGENKSAGRDVAWYSLVVGVTTLKESQAQMM